MPKEEWRDVSDYEGLYQVSDLGRVRSSYNLGKFIKGDVCKGNYRRVQLCKDKVVKRDLVHRLVAKAFHLNPDDFPIVRHLNGDAMNNTAVNLAWGTYHDNVMDSRRHGTFNHSKGDAHYNAVLNCQKVKLVRLLYSYFDFTQQQLAEMFDVGQWAISKVVNRKTWKHI